MRPSGADDHTVAPAAYEDRAVTIGWAFFIVSKHERSTWFATLSTVDWLLLLAMGFSVITVVAFNVVSLRKGTGPVV
jgi:hypothetical protein